MVNSGTSCLAGNLIAGYSQPAELAAKEEECHPGV